MFWSTEPSTLLYPVSVIFRSSWATNYTEGGICKEFVRLDQLKTVQIDKTIKKNMTKMAKTGEN